MFQALLSPFDPSFYLQPWSLLAGLLLVSAPIIIHLINRMRYKRVRFAAMEFLLKAQKRMKRKMIIEQLILLLLRILLMILIGLLLARFLGFDLSGQEARSTHHLVLIDDSPSMADGYKADDGQQTNAFEQIKRVLISQIAPTAAQATTPQSMELMRMSDLKSTRNIARLNSGSIDEITTELGKYAPSTVRTDLAVALTAAKEQILKTGGSDTSRVLHVMTDCRSNDWAEHGPAIKNVVEELTKAGVKVHIIDTAYPYRKAEKRVPLFNDNIAIIDFTPSKIVVAQSESVEFTLRVQNFGTSELKDVRFSIRVNGDENLGKSEPIPSLPPGQIITKKFDLTFNADKDFNAENPFKRFQIVTVVMETAEPGGLTIDNSRHTVVEVRKKLPVLVIDGQPTLRESRAGDSIYLKGHFQANGSGYLWTPGQIGDLEKGDLNQYSFVLLLNVPSLSKSSREALEKYTQSGGGVGFFLGPNVKPSEYNKELYRDGAGLFPVPLPEQPSKELTVEELEKKKFSIFQKKILLRDPAMRFHPALEGIYINKAGQYDPKESEQLEKFYRFVTVKRYWPIKRIGKWRQDKSVSELYCMPNEEPISNFERQSIDAAKKLPTDDEDFVKFKKILTEMQSKISTAAGRQGDLSDLAAMFDRMLSDQTSEGDADEALLREFWSNPKSADLKAEFGRLRDAMKFGDPLYMAKQFGRGRVSVMFTTAGEAWNDWPTEKPGSASFSPVVQELTKYLSGGGTDENRSCGDAIQLKLDIDSYAAKARYAFVTHDGKPGGGRQAPGTNVDPAPLKVAEKDEALEVNTFDEKVIEKVGDQEVEKTVPREVLLAKIRDTKTPGIHLFELTQLRANPGNPGEKIEIKEYRAVPVNVDALHEGELLRASTDDIAQQSPGVEIHSPDETDWIDKLKNKKTDLTELGWLFLAFLLVLLMEQAMAVRLSYHANAEGLGNLSPAAAQAMRKSTAPLESNAG